MNSETGQTPLGKAGKPDVSSWAADLRPFADQLMEIAQHLREGEFGANFQEPTSSAEPNNSKDDQSLEKRRVKFAGLARETYLLRRQRSTIFGSPELFGEPAWDILLDLYIAFVDKKPVSVSSACIGSAAPPTTGLRWLGVLADQGLVIREQDPEDQRRVLVRLTEDGISAMDRYFGGLRQLSRTSSRNRQLRHKSRSYPFLLQYG